MQQEDLNLSFWEALYEEYIEDILSMSDKEILDEVKINFDDVNENLEKNRFYIYDTVMKKRRERFKITQATYTESRTNSKALEVIRTLSFEEKQNKIYELLHNTPNEFGELTLAFREGKQITEKDMDGLLEDLLELGLDDEKT